MASCLLMVALTMLLLSFVATGVAFFAPFWLVSLTDHHTEGLWGYCPAMQDCQWFYEDDFAIEKNHRGFVVCEAVALHFEGEWTFVFRRCCLCEFHVNNDQQIKDLFHFLVYRSNAFVKDDWFKAVQAMFAFGYVMQIAVLLIGVLHVCCLCCKGSAAINKIIGSVLKASFVLTVVALAVFGGMAYKDDRYKASIHSITYNFDWAFYVAIVGAGLDVLAGLLFFCAGMRKMEHDGYERGNVVI
ncbi:hypothetical protein CAPTEDRAFT_225145 [Capitella teleta]|uniref:Uncharacterized protein n=1 Tax=Capitella teleta TaxID=283909 RepID=R7U0Z8_CAPTE|nr:hypothetical protein CAPTEDRAFT_225145 [Capitella teleta]|eukprot:ELT99878.1 hypothetical protein CAPTEDRAFT_225145 [Capitella teleta]